MKTILKTTLVALAMALPMHASANTDGDKAIPPGKLPKAALQTISAHLPGRKIAIAKVETELFSKSYTVIFTNGEKIEFDRSGNWTEIDCKRSEVPAKLVPTQIKNYVNTNYSGNKILKIEKDRNEYEINLSNGVEVKFNKNFMVIDID